MRKIKNFFLLFTLIVSIAVLTSCSKDDDADAQSVLVNITHNGTLASPSSVQLFDYNDASKCKFDYDAMCKYGDNRVLITENGAEITPKYVSSSTVGVNTFEGVKNGEYMLVAMYKPGGYSYPMFYYYAYKKISVNASNNAKLYTIDFSNSDMGKFVKF